MRPNTCIPYLSRGTLIEEGHIFLKQIHSGLKSDHGCIKGEEEANEPKRVFVDLCQNCLLFLCNPDRRRRLSRNYGMIAVADEDGGREREVQCLGAKGGAERPPPRVKERKKGRQ